MATRGRPRKSLVDEQAGAIEAPGLLAESAPEVDQRRLQDYPRADRENAMKLGGLALRELGRRYGIPRSSMDRMDDAKLRRQISIAQENATQEQAAA